MTQQSTVTVTGYVGADPKLLGEAEGKVPCCVFRVASTRRYFSRKDGKWEDLPTTWMQVRTYRTLALNIKDSISRGDPVIVNGQLISDSWKDSQGNTRTALSIEAQSVGHDLSRGVSKFRRMSPMDRDNERANEEAMRRVEAMQADMYGGGYSDDPGAPGISTDSADGRPQGTQAAPGTQAVPGTQTALGTQAVQVTQGTQGATVMAAPAVAMPKPSEVTMRRPVVATAAPQQAQQPGIAAAEPPETQDSSNPSNEFEENAGF